MSTDFSNKVISRSADSLSETLEESATDTHVTDEQLMLAYQRGDADAFELLYRKYKNSVYRFFLRQTDNSAFADELHQDTWMKLINSKERWQPAALFKTYLFTLSRNTLIDHYRKQGRHVEQFENSHSDAEFSEHTQLTQLLEEQLEQETLRDAFQAALAELPLTQREAFLFKEEAGLSLDEIAAITHINKEGVKSRLRYAMQKLKGSLHHYLTNTNVNQHEQ